MLISVAERQCRYLTRPSRDATNRGSPLPLFASMQPLHAVEADLSGTPSSVIRRRLPATALFIWPAYYLLVTLVHNLDTLF